jgi:hypothetical protein
LDSTGGSCHWSSSNRRTNALLDNPHAVDLMRYFIDSTPQAVHAGKSGGNTANPSITTLIEFESDAAGILILNNDAGGVSEQVELRRRPVGVPEHHRSCAAVFGSDLGR